MDQLTGYLECQPYPLPGDPGPEPCRHCGRLTIPAFDAWMDTEGRTRCPSDWADHEPLPGDPAFDGSDHAAIRAAIRADYVAITSARGGTR